MALDRGVLSFWRDETLKQTHDVGPQHFRPMLPRLALRRENSSPRPQVTCIRVHAVGPNSTIEASLWHLLNSMKRVNEGRTDV